MQGPLTGPSENFLRGGDRKAPWGIDLVDKPACGNSWPVFLSAEINGEGYCESNGDSFQDLMHGDVNGSKAQFGGGPEHDTHVVSEKSWKHSPESPAPALRPEN
jgi:hypothetical protein